MQLERRVFLQRAKHCVLAGAALPLLSGGILTAENDGGAPQASGLPRDWRHIAKIDCHMHISSSPRDGEHGNADAVIEAANALGIELLCASRPTSSMASPAEVREANDLILAAMKRHPGRILGYCFLIPGYKETIPELERCLDAGMMGVKLYNQHKYSDPICFPIVEHCIERKVPILGHAGHVRDSATIRQQPNISDAAQFCELAERYPEAMLIHAHVCGGGDWEWAIKRLRNCSSVYLDTSGSVLDEHTVDMAVEVLGHERVIFGTDTLMETGVGKVLGANLTPSQRSDIFANNMRKILARRTA